MALQLKIELASQNKQQAFRFNQEMTVHEVCKQIREKNADNASTGADHGLFQPADGVRPGRWLRPERTLMYYDLKSGDVLIYKKKHRPLKVKLMDDTVKTVLVDDSNTVIEITDVVAEKLSLPNSEEYSLARETPEGRALWLHPTQSLQEQGIDEKEILLLKKKFFVTDANVDRSDPIQLHLLYVQCRDAITHGHTPVAFNEACSLAALSLQVEQGNFNPTRDVKGSLKERITKLLAPAHIKQAKEPEKDIFAEWKKLSGMTEINAKFRYVQLCRSLKTYGITCFEVLEKPTRGKKWTPILLGVTKDNIYRMDSVSKEILKTNKLTELRRWAASPKTFTLDFGDYETDYYTVQTTEGESISQLIAGYIDIILKRKKDFGRAEREDDSTVAVEEFVAPVMAASVETTTSTIGLGAYDGAQGKPIDLHPAAGVASMGSVSMQGLGNKGVQVGKTGVLGAPRPITDVDSAESAINNLLDGLESGAPWARLPSELTPEQWKQKLQETLASAGKNVTDLIKNAQNGDKTAMNSAAKLIFQNIQDLVNAARMAAAENDDDISLLEGAKKVSEAVARILNTAKALAEDPNNPELQAKMAEAAKLLQAAQLYMGQALQAKLLSDKVSEDLILASARAVSEASAQLANTTNDVARGLSDPNARDKILKSVEAEEKAAEYCYQTSKMLAGVILAPGAKNAVEESAHGVQNRMGELLRMAKLGVTDPSLLDKIAKASKNLNDAVSQLLLANDCASGLDAADIPSQVKALREGVIMIERNPGKKGEMMAGAKAVTASSTQLVGSAKSTAKLLDQAAADRLLASARVLADATGTAGGSAKTAIANPADSDAYRKLLEAVRRCKDAAEKLVDDAGKAVAYRSLQATAKVAAAACTGLVQSGRGATEKMRDPVSKGKLLDDTGRLNDAIQKLLDAVRNAVTKPDDPAAQNELMTIAREVAVPATATIATAKTSVPKVEDMVAKQQLNVNATAAQNAVQEMLLAVKRVAEATGAKEIENAILETDTAIAGMDALLLSAEVGMLEPSGVPMEEAMKKLATAATFMGQAANDLRETAFKQPDKVGEASKPVGTGIGEVSEAAKKVAHATGDKTVQMAVLSGAKQVATKARDQINAAKAKMVNPKDRGAAEDLDRATQALKDALAALLGAASGADVASKECDDAIGAIEDDLENIDPNATATVDWARAAEELEAKTKTLSNAVTQLVVAARSNPKNVANMSKATQLAFHDVVLASNGAIGASPSPPAKTAIANGSRNVGKGAARLITAAKLAKQDPSRLDKAFLDLNNAIQSLLNAIDMATPGAQEIQDALKEIQAALARAGQADGSRDAQANRKILNDAAKALGESVGQMSVAARNSPEKLGGHAKDSARSVGTIVVAAHNLTPDYIELNQPSDKILEQLTLLTSTATSIAAAKEIAKSTSTIVNQSKAFIVNNPEALDDATKRDLINAANNLAALCSRLAETSKNFVRGDAGAATQLQEISAEFKKKVQAVKAVNTKVAAKARSNPALVNAARSLADATGALLGILKAVATRPKDASVQSQMSTAVVGVSDNIKRLLDASTNLVPGQKECDEAIVSIQAQIGDLASAAMTAAVGCFQHTPPRGKSVQDVQERVVDISKDLATTTSKLVEATFKNQSQIGPTAKSISDSITLLAASTKDLSATTSDPTTQQERLNLAKSLADDTLQLVKAVKTYSANPTQANQLALIDHAKSVRDAIGSIVGNLKGNVMGLRQCDEAIAAIAEAERILDQPPPPSSLTYQQVIANLQAHGRDLVLGVTGMLSEAHKGNNETVGSKSTQVAQKIQQLMETTVLAASATAEPGSKAKLIQAGKGVSRSTGHVVANAKNLTEDPKNPDLQAKLNASFNACSEAIRGLTSAIREGARGERDCVAALDEIQKTNADLDTAVLFASTGSLDAQIDPNKTLEDYHNGLLNAVKALASDANKLQTGSKVSLEDVGTAARGLATSLAHLGKNAKSEAFLLSDNTTQQSVLQSAKSVGLLAAQLVALGRETQANQGGAEAKAKLAQTTQEFHAALQTLQQSANDASGDIIAAIRELEKGRQQVNQAIESNSANPKATAADLVTAARRIVKANNDLVGSIGGNTETLIASAKETSGATAELIEGARGAARTAPDANTQRALIESTKAAGAATSRLLEAAKFNKLDTSEAQTRVQGLNEEVTDKIQAVIQAVRALPGGADAELEENDLAAVAEQELLNAANQIEACARRIMTARDMASVPIEEKRLAEISEAILEAARSITRATATLVQAATVSQKEIIAKGRANKLANPYKKDPLWAQGLISAAKAVAGTTEDLVNSANDASQRKAGEEVLVAAARGVAGATARLVAASKAKADPSSPSQRKLEVAAKAVAQATSSLVDAAKIAAQVEEEERQRKVDEESSRSAAQERKKEFEQAVEIARLEKELERARQKYGQIQKEKYTGSTAPAPQVFTSPRPTPGTPKGGAGAPKASPRFGAPSASDQ